MSSSENFFGIERLEETIAKLQNPNPETTAKAILSAARKFPILINNTTTLQYWSLSFPTPSTDGIY
jgi:hypothetical protein